MQSNYFSSNNLLGKGNKRKPFKISTQKREWNKSAGRNETEFKTTSKCRNCPRKLTWKDRTYEFDHKDNNNSNNSQSNCYLVCKICHGRATKIEKRRIKDKLLGITLGHKTIKRRFCIKNQKNENKRLEENSKGIFLD